MMKNLGERITEARKRTGLTQMKFAEQLEIAYQTLNKYEKGHRTPDAELVHRMVILTKVSAGWLLTGVETEEIEVYDQDEKNYCRKFLRIIRTKQDKTVAAIKQNVDAFLDTPDKAVVKKNLQNG